MNSLCKLYLQCLQEKLKCEKGETQSDIPKKKEKETIILRPLNMTDLKEAKNQVNPSSYQVEFETMWKQINTCQLEK